MGVATNTVSDLGISMSDGNAYRTGCWLACALFATAASAQQTQPTASLSVSRLVATETTGAPVLISVQIDQAIDRDLPIQLSLVGGTAVSGVDFLAPDSPPVIPAGATQASVEIRIRDDDMREQDETIAIALAAGAGYQIGMPRLLIVLIRDDDANEAELRERLQRLIDNAPDELIASQIETLGRLCANGMPAAGSELATRCSRLRLALLDTAAAMRLVDSLRGLVAEELSSQRRGFRMIANGQLGGISRRLEVVRQGGGRGLSLSGLQFGGQALPLDYLGEGDSGDASGLLGQSLGLFVSGTLGRGERNASELESGFDTDNRSILIGVDKRISSSWVVGAAVGYSQFEADLDDDAGELNMDLSNVTAYVSYSRADGWIDASAGIGRGDLMQLRTAVFETTTDEDTVVSVDVLRATPDADLTSASLSGGWDFHSGRWNFGPRLALEYANLEVESYAERVVSGSDSFAVQIAKQELRSLLVRAGIGISAAISTQYAVFLPQFEIYYVSQLEDDVEALRGQFINDPTGELFSIPTSAVDDQNGEFSFGVTAVFAQGRSAFFSYRQQFGVNNIKQEFFSVGARVEF